MGGYYSSLLQAMQQGEQIKGARANRQLREQELQMNRMQMDQQRQEQSLLTQAFAGGSDIRQGASLAERYATEASRLEAAGNKIMGLNPTKGLAMIREAANLRRQQGSQELTNVNTAMQKNEYLSTVAMEVFDQTSLDAAVQDLAKQGMVVPLQYRQWGPDAQKWWAKRGEVAKKNLDALKVQATTQRVQNAAQREQDLEKHREERETQKDREYDLKKQGLADRKIAGLQSRRDRAKALGDKEAVDEYDRQIQELKTGKKAPPSVKDLQGSPEAQKIKEDFAAGTLTREQALAKLQALFEEQGGVTQGED